MNGSERMAKHRAKGRNIGVVLTDPDAIKALDKLAKAHGGIKAAIEYALTQAKSKSPH